MLELPRPWRAALRPWRGFDPEGWSPTLGAALGRMLLARGAVGLLSAALTLRAAAETWDRVRRLEGPVGEALLRALGGEVQAEDLRQALGGLPALPRPGAWLVAVVPLGILGEWLHHGVWDHVGLWVLGGLGTKRGLRRTLLAEAEAMEAGTVGALLGLGAFLPGSPAWAWLPLGAVGAWFWILRGFALAAHHGCPPWKGVLATLVHAALMLCCGCGLLFLCGLALQGLG